ncbi:Transcriptional regulator, TetR family protein [Enhygromyxa salina]|uniref:Transcriptional regulator, TetR family protein n=1 Tax=Enhygromyxa salina TaxID=215803 RepID=A0A0C2CSY8_9BACT|nr:TetR/AcrR family transcriptional regulator [Enhygromyxa salina]KIG14276.1 Transcriptional regulator, TetR family protein [Enhygromyxa salina]
MTELSPIADDTRARIIVAAAGLIASGGRDAATTRAVAAAAAVQAPTIYRLFGDKRGLLDAVAEYEMAAYMTQKAARRPHPDPVQDLRDGWDMHVAFGLGHPGLFAIMSGGPDQRPASAAVAAGLELLRGRVRRIALAGRLRVSEQRAVALLHAVGTGTVLALLGQPDEQRDCGLSEVAREAVVAAITTEAVAPAQPGPSGAATALRASLDQSTVLTSGERHLLEELLERIANA